MAGAPTVYDYIAWPWQMDQVLDVMLEQESEGTDIQWIQKGITNGVKNALDE